MLSVVIPTIAGREESLARCVASYTTTLTAVSHEIIIVKNDRSWPWACNEGYSQSQGDIIHWTADDLEALPGWFDDIPEALEVDELPAPRVMDYRADGKHANEVDGPDGAFCEFTRIPIMRRDQAERIGPWPEITYYADIWVSDKARALGIPTRLLYSYAFIHHWSPIGRVDSTENLVRSGHELRALREEMADASPV